MAEKKSGSGSHFVLIHGACHGAWCWYKVETLLRLAGHRVTALDLAASGVNLKQLRDLFTMSDFLEPLTEFMAALPVDEKVVLVGHSMGGVAISVAMERFPQKISVAIFVTAFMPGPDFSFLDITQQYTPREDIPVDNIYTFDQGPDKPPTSFLFGPIFISSKLYQLSPPEDVILANSLVRPFPCFTDAKSFEDTIVTKERYGSVHRVFIVCGQDYGIEVDIQRWFMKNNPPDEVKEIADSDHMVMLSHPQELCSYLLAYAE
ncbi:hypothetical protein RJ639_025970 [Escallonia herrerae]|uniref:AB hydrolase-1 domain-containing protein n=1 Tax=Escallonia herrerae TaxID=1293975 RepID=A0AA89ABL1_9ASTE|nr:hypothetical protein RJ639_025970 [Escallonia herrerae]